VVGRPTVKKRKGGPKTGRLFFCGPSLKKLWRTGFLSSEFHGGQPIIGAAQFMQCFGSQARHVVLACGGSAKKE